MSNKLFGVIDIVRRVLDTYHAARSLKSFSFAVQLIPEALDVVQSIGDDNRVSSERAFDRRVFRRSGIFLRASFSIYIPAQAKCLIVDMDHRQAADPRLGGSFDLGVEEIDQLIRAISLA